VVVGPPAAGAWGDLKTPTFTQIWHAPAHRTGRLWTPDRLAAKPVGQQADGGYCPRPVDNRRVACFYRWFSHLSLRQEVACP
jgi:hypothetical protein